MGETSPVAEVEHPAVFKVGETLWRARALPPVRQLDYIGLYQIISDYIGSYRIILDYIGSYRIISDYIGLHRIILDRKALFAHSVCANFGLNTHSVCASFSLIAHSPVYSVHPVKIRKCMCTFGLCS